MKTVKSKNTTPKKLKKDPSRKEDSVFSVSYTHLVRVYPTSDIMEGGTEKSMVLQDGKKFWHPKNILFIMQ